jgi:hypothetical protein
MSNSRIDENLSDKTFPVVYRTIRPLAACLPSQAKPSHASARPPAVAVRARVAFYYSFLNFSM